MRRKRRWSDKFIFKAAWMIWSFVIGYSVAIIGVETEMFGYMGTEVNNLVKAFGGVQTILLILAIWKFATQRRREKNGANYGSDT